MNGIKEIFVPDEQEIKDAFNGTIEDIERSLGVQLNSIEFLEGVTERPVQDIESDYSLHGVGTFHLKFFDTKFLTQGVDFFRPLIRGFIVLLLLFYNYRQLLTFLGQDPAIAHNAMNNAEKSIKESGK